MQDIYNIQEWSHKLLARNEVLVKLARTSSLCGAGVRGAWPGRVEALSWDFILKCGNLPVVMWEEGWDWDYDHLCVSPLPPPFLMLSLNNSFIIWVGVVTDLCVCVGKGVTFICVELKVLTDHLVQLSCFEKGPSCVVLAGFELKVICLPQPSECWNCMRVPACPSVQPSEFCH